MSKKRLWISLALVVVLAAGAVGWKVYSDRAEKDRAIQQIELDFEVELERASPELGSFPARVRAVDGWEQIPALRRLLARVYLVQARPAEALDALEPLIAAMSPELEDAMLGGTACLLKHRVSGGADLLRRAQGLFRTGDSAVALGRQWQCAVRLGDEESRKQLVGRLGDMASQPEARLARLHEDWVARQPVDEGELIRVTNDLEASGSLGEGGALEAQLLDVALKLERGQLDAAERILEPLLGVAPAVVPVRRLAALELCAKLERDSELAPAELGLLRSHLRWLLDQRQGVEGREMFEQILGAIGG